MTIKDLLQDYYKGDPEAGWDIVLYSGSVHAREEYLGAWNSGDWDAMDCAVRHALKAVKIK